MSTIHWNPKDPLPYDVEAFELLKKKILEQPLPEARKMLGKIMEKKNLGHIDAEYGEQIVRDPDLIKIATTLTSEDILKRLLE